VRDSQLISADCVSVPVSALMAHFGSLAKLTENRGMPVLYGLDTPVPDAK